MNPPVNLPPKATIHTLNIATATPHFTTPTAPTRQDPAFNFDFPTAIWKQQKGPSFPRVITALWHPVLTGFRVDLYLQTLLGSSH